LGKEKENTDNDDSTGVDIEGRIPDFAEVDPSFIGGMNNMVTFILLNILRPAEAIIMRERGVVYIKFIVDKDGSVTNVEIRKGVSKILDREATRVIQLMPNWIPGEQMNEPVSVSFTLPIDFQ
jgi:protein TonB